MLGEKGMWGKEGMLLIRAGILAAGRVSRARAGARDAVWFLKKTQLLLARRVANSVISLFILPARQKKKSVFSAGIWDCCEGPGAVGSLVCVKMQLSQENLMCLDRGWLSDEVKNLSPEAFVVKIWGD